MLRAAKVLGFVLFIITLRSWGATPACLSQKAVLPIDNQRALSYKTSTPSGYKTRAHVLGVVQATFGNQGDHTHFVLQIGQKATDNLEIIYNREFGELPALKVGDQVDGCGDYITSTQQNGPYPPSPMGAILHWVHENPNGRGHESGFLVINNTLYGWVSKVTAGFLPEQLNFSSVNR